MPPSAAAARCATHCRTAARHHLDRHQHLGVLDAAELGAPAAGRLPAFVAVNHVWLSRPGIASILPAEGRDPPRVDDVPVGRRHVELHRLPTGTRSRSMATAPFGYVNCQRTAGPVTVTSRRPPAPALGTFLMPGQLDEDERRDRHEDHDGDVVHIDSSRVEPWICGPSRSAAACAAGSGRRTRRAALRRPRRTRSRSRDEPVASVMLCAFGDSGATGAKPPLPASAGAASERATERRPRQGAASARAHAFYERGRRCAGEPVRLPGDVKRPFEVFVNGVPQQEGVDFEVMGGVLAVRARADRGRSASGAGRRSWSAWPGRTARTTRSTSPTASAAGAGSRRGFRSNPSTVAREAGFRGSGILPLRSPLSAGHIPEGVGFAAARATPGCA